MTAKYANIISEIRSFNHFYTNILGLLNKHILDSPYSLTEIRVLLEIDRQKDCTANFLIERLSMDKGYMSRLLKSFEADGRITKESSAADRRMAYLHLTPEGKRILADLEKKSDSQVEGLIDSLTDGEKEKLADAMKYIQKALENNMEVQL